MKKGELSREKKAGIREISHARDERADGPMADPVRYPERKKKGKELCHTYHQNTRGRRGQIDRLERPNRRMRCLFFLERERGEG